MNRAVVANQLLRVPQVAQVLSVSVRTVYRMIAEGELPRPVKVRGCSCLRAEDVASYVERLNRGRHA